ncbi:MAG: cytidine deaminase [Clostridia bacterium]|nr:cytidine deaminase [Clostridia bacterium]
MNYPIKEALKARENAYSPYSRFCVGAALLCKNGNVYTGCNIENASYSVTVCAERVAIGNAITHGDREFQAIVICGSSDDYCFPCGICRQTLSEFVDADFEVVMAKSENDYKVFKMGELLPQAFKL